VGEKLKKQDFRGREIANNITLLYGQKIVKFSCKFPSVWTENSELLHNFRPYGQKIAYICV